MNTIRGNELRRSTLNALFVRNGALSRIPVVATNDIPFNTYIKRKSGLIYANGSRFSLKEPTNLQLNSLKKNILLDLRHEAHEKKCNFVFNANFKNNIQTFKFLGFTIWRYTIYAIGDAIEIAETQLDDHHRHEML